MNCKQMGPLSRNLLAVNSRKIQQKEKESVSEQYIATNRDRWTGTYPLQIVKSGKGKKVSSQRIQCQQRKS